MSPVLDLDIEGDGSVDFVISANQRISADVYTLMFIKIIETLDLSDGISVSLTSKLESAFNMLKRGNTKAASNIVNAFINEVRALQDKDRFGLNGDSLIELAEELLKLINSQ